MAVRLVEKVTGLATYLRAFFQTRSASRPELNQRFGYGTCQSGVRLLISLLLSCSLLGCASQSRQVRLVELPDIPSDREVRRLSGPISEVAPPAIFSDLAKLRLDQQPQVAIASPKPNQTIDSTHLEVKLELQNFSVYKDESLGLGPHIQLILDNQPARSLYSLDETVAFADLAPGSHTLRAIAVQPWGESFKNETAYAQTTFHVFAKTDENTPDPTLPLLTFIEPQGTVTAEPLLLDFYLTNAPLHFLAQENAEDELSDWKIQGTVNGKSFIFDQWRPIYLMGFEPGKSWIQLTLIDDRGDPIKNAFNSTVRVVDYAPTQPNTLAKLVRGELPLQEAGQIVDPTYQPPAEVVLDGSETVETDEVKPNPPARDETEEVETEETEIEQPKAEEVVPDIPELDTEAFDGDAAEMQRTAPAIPNSDQLEADQSEKETVDETEASQSTSVEPTPEKIEVEQPSQAVTQTEAAPKKENLFKKFFGRKQPSSQTTEPTAEQSSDTDREPTYSIPALPEPQLSEPQLSEPQLLEPDTSLETDDVAASVRSDEPQLEPTEDAADLKDTDKEETTDKVLEVPTDLSAPATPTDNVLAPEQAELPIVLEELDIQNPDATKAVEERIDIELDGDEELEIDKALGN